MSTPEQRSGHVVTPPAQPGGRPATEPVKRARHLMDPANPVRTVNDPALTHVQRWVMSILAGTTIMHLAVGLVVAAWFIDDPVSAYGLCIIAGAFGVLAVVLGRAIHQIRPASGWVLLGLLPGTVGAVLVALR